MGVHALPLTLVGGVAYTAFSVTMICVVQGPFGDGHHFIFMCPALAPVRDLFRPLLASGTQSLCLLVWQQDLREVVRFVHECFVFRSTLLGRCGLVHFMSL
jgi:hypothetical protein